MAKVYKRGAVYYARATHRGVEHRESLETTSRATAEERLQTWLARLKGSDWGEKPRRTFRETAIRFTGDYFPRLKPKSRERYRVSLMNLADHFDGLHLDEITSARMAEFETARRKEGVTAGTIRRDLSCLSSVFSRAEEWEYSQGNPAAAYLRHGTKRGLKEAPPKTRYLSHEEEQTILTAISLKAGTVAHERDRHGWQMFEYAVMFAIDTGLRSEEQFSITWREVDLDRMEVVVPDSKAKSGVGRRVPILPRTARMLQDIPRHAGCPYVFWHGAGQRYFSMHQQLKRLTARLGITGLSWHDLRRTCGCRLIQDYGLAMEKVSLWLGHSSVGVTERVYAFLDVRHLHAALKIGAQTTAHLTLIEGRKVIEMPVNIDDLKDEGGTE